MLLKQNHSIWSEYLKKKQGALQYILSYRFYIPHRKEAVALKFSTKELFRKKLRMVKSLFIWQVYCVGKYSTNSIFRMILWNFLKQASVIRLSLSKSDCGWKKQHNTQRANALHFLFKIIRCFFVHFREILLCCLQEKGARRYSNDQLLLKLTWKRA